MDVYLGPTWSFWRLTAREKKTHRLGGGAAGAAFIGNNHVEPALFFYPPRRRKSIRSNHQRDKFLGSTNYCKAPLKAVTRVRTQFSGK